jgi:type VI secretion system secreted protein Hcp
MTSPRLKRRRPGRSGLAWNGRSLFGLLVFLAFNPGPAEAAIFMRLEGVLGESTEAGHQGWIELSSFYQHNAAVEGGIVGSGQLTKRMDKSSPKLAEGLALGRVFPELELEVARTEGETRRLFRLVLRNVEIFSYRMWGAGESPGTEHVAFLFEWAEWTYVEMDGSGRPLANHKAQWDFLRNAGGSGTERVGFVVRATQSPGEVPRLEWEAEEGRVYHLMGAMNLNEPFQLVQEIPPGNPGMRSLEMPSVNRFGFYYLTEHPE